MVQPRNPAIQPPVANVVLRDVVVLPRNRSAGSRVGIGIQAQELGPDGREPGRTDYVPGERIPYPARALEMASRRIVNREEPAGVVEGLREIALPLFERRDRAK